METADRVEATPAECQKHSVGFLKHTDMNTSTDKLVTLEFARLHLIPHNPHTGKPYSKIAVWRWWRHGSDGVKLRIQKVGRTSMTTQTWLTDFYNARSAAAQETEQS